MRDPAATATAEAATSAFQAGPLQTSLRDLALAVEWRELRVVALPNTSWTVIIGHKKPSDPLRAVLPLPLHTTSLHPSSLREIFSSLSELSVSSLPPALPPFVPSIDELQRIRHRAKPDHDLIQDQFQEDEAKEVAAASVELDRDMIYMAIVTTDSTVVYYRLTKGIKKPADIPDE